MLKNLHKLSIVFMGLFFFSTMIIPTSTSISYAKNTLSIQEVQENTTGLWRYKKDDTIRFYFFGAESIDLGKNVRSTVELNENSDLIMNLSVLGTNANNELKPYKVIDIKKHKIVLQDTYGQKIILKRVRRDIFTVKGTLAYRERIALPENVAVRVNLYADGELLTTKAFDANGAIPIPFDIHFLGDKKYLEETELSFTAAIYANYEALFETQNPILVTDEYITISKFSDEHNDKKEQVSDDSAHIAFSLEIQKKGEELDIILNQAQKKNSATPEINESIANEALLGTYWRLISLEGQSVYVANSMPEPHLIIKEGQGVGSDGCNRFSLPINNLENSVSNQQNQSISFQIGASTMMLCQEGEEQAQHFMQNLATIDNYAISGNKLFLNEDLDTKLIFEATPL